VHGLQYDTSWLTEYPVNPLAVGQYVNNGTRGLSALCCTNCSFFSFHQFWFSHVMYLSHISYVVESCSLSTVLISGGHPDSSLRTKTCLETCSHWL